MKWSCKVARWPQNCWRKKYVIRRNLTSQRKRNYLNWQLIQRERKVHKLKLTWRVSDTVWIEETNEVNEVCSKNEFERCGRNEVPRRIIGTVKQIIWQRKTSFPIKPPIEWFGANDYCWDSPEDGHIYKRRRSTEHSLHIRQWWRYKNRPRGTTYCGAFAWLGGQHTKLHGCGS